MKIGIEAISNLYQRLYVMRRYNTTPCSVSENVSSHSYLVALLTLLLANNDKHNTERAVGMALVHDMDECMSGDVNALAKRFHPRINEALEEASGEFMSIILEKVNKKEYLYELYCGYKNRDSEEANLVKMADIISRIIPMTMEARMGNKYAKEIVSNSYLALKEICFDEELLLEIHNYIAGNGIGVQESIRRW